MLRTILFYLAVFSTCTVAVWAELNCTAVPISLAVANSTLDSGVKRRGVAVELGTPLQKFSFNVAAKYNNTYFQEGPMTKDNCPMDSDTPAARCITLKGGVFDRDASFTWLPQTKQSFRGSSQDYYTVLDTFDRGQDVLSTSEFNLTNYPVGLLSTWTGNSADRGILGLSINSTLLETLIEVGKVPSNSWALDNGWSGYDETWVDGTLTLGGYDKSKFQGDLYPQDFSVQSDGRVDQECALKVTIESMVMTNSSGSVDLLPGGKSEAKLACVTPDYPLITLPGSMFDIFNQKMNGKYSDDQRSVGAFYLWGFVDSHAPFYDGSLTIRLSNGFETTIPNHELVVPYRDINAKGQPVILNGAEQRVLLLNALRSPNDKDLPLLGIPFLSAAYLVVNNDQQKFYLAKPTRTNKRRREDISDLVPLLPSSCNSGFVSPMPTAHTTEAAERAPTASNSSSASTKTGNNMAAIGGGIGAAIAGVLLVAGGAFYFVRRRAVTAAKNIRQLPYAHKNGEEVGGFGQPPAELSVRHPPNSQRYEADSNMLLQPVPFPLAELDASDRRSRHRR